MVKIPRYAQTHIPQAVGTPGVDQTAGREAAMVSELARTAGQVFKAQKAIADQATASKLNRQATLEYGQRVAEIKKENPNDPETVVKLVEEAGDEIFNQDLSGITSPEVRNNYITRANSTITSQVLSAANWAANKQKERANIDFQQSRIINSQALGQSPDINTFLRSAREYAVTDSGLYKARFGEKAPQKLKEDLNLGAQGFIRNQIDQGPFTAKAILDSGKLDNYLSPTQKDSVQSLANTAVKNFEKNREADAKTKLVVSSGELGRKFKAGKLTPQDLTNEIARVEQMKDAPQRYLVGLKTWRDNLLTKREVPSSTQKGVYHKRNKQLTALAEIDGDKVKFSDDPDRLINKITQYRADLQEDYNNGSLSKKDFTDLYNDTLFILDKTAEETNAMTGERWFDGPKEVLSNTNRAYTEFDIMFNEPNVQQQLNGMPEEERDRIKLQAKIEFHKKVNERFDRTGRMLERWEFDKAVELTTQNIKEEIEKSSLRSFNFDDL